MRTTTAKHADWSARMAKKYPGAWRDDGDPDLELDPGLGPLDPALKAAVAGALQARRRHAAAADLGLPPLREPRPPLAPAARKALDGLIEAARRRAARELYPYYWAEYHRRGLL